PDNYRNCTVPKQSQFYLFYNYSCVAYDFKTIHRKIIRENVYLLNTPEKLIVLNKTDCSSEQQRHLKLLTVENSHEQGRTEGGMLETFPRGPQALIPARG